MRRLVYFEMAVAMAASITCAYAQNCDAKIALQQALDKQFKLTKVFE